MKRLLASIGAGLLSVLLLFLGVTFVLWEFPNPAEWDARSRFLLLLWTLFFSGGVTIVTYVALEEWQWRKKW